MYLEVDDHAVQAMLGDVASGLTITDADLDEVADYLVTRILGRTRRGVDVYGQPFTPYAASTRRDRDARGRTTSRVTLQDTGKMLASMRGRGQAGAALVYFASRTQGRKARWHDEGLGDNPERHFLGASDADLDGAADILIRRMTQRL